MTRSGSDCACHKPGRLVAAALGLKADDWSLSFQSRVGREEWLKPYTDETLKRWGSEGLESVQVVCPGFSADCLETLEEVAMENRDFFLEAGGEKYSYIPCLNDDDAHMAALAAVVEAIGEEHSPAGAEEAAAAEIRCALQLTRRAADAELELALDLRRRLPQVWGALSTGTIDVRRARVLVDATLHLSVAGARDVVAQVIDEAPRLTTGQLGARVRRAMVDASTNRRMYTCPGNRTPAFHTGRVP